MNREALFRKKTVSAAGNVSTAVFYGISGIVFLMILTGIPAAPFLAPQTEALEQGFGASDPAVVSAFLQMLVHDASSDGSHGGRLWLGGAEGICADGAGKNWRRGG